jgi:hypothetical protein
MARAVSWLPRLHEIRRRVEGSARSHYERKEIETLFELQPRAAQMLVEMLPGVAVGRSRLVEREALVQFLERIRLAEDVPAEMDRIRTERAGVSRKKIRTMVRTDHPVTSLDALPSSVAFSRCRVEISFRTIEELAQAMYAVAQAIETDGDEMARLYEVEPEPVEDLGKGDLERMFEELREMRWRG